MHLVPRPEVLFVACVYMIVHVHVCIQYYAELAARVHFRSCHVNSVVLLFINFGVEYNNNIAYSCRCHVLHDVCMYSYDHKLCICTMLMFACSCTHTAALASSMHVGGWDVWFVVLLRVGGRARDKGGCIWSSACMHGYSPVEKRGGAAIDPYMSDSLMFTCRDAKLHVSQDVKLLWTLYVSHVSLHVVYFLNFYNKHG